MCCKRMKNLHHCRGLYLSRSPLRAACPNSHLYGEPVPLDRSGLPLILPLTWRLRMTTTVVKFIRFVISPFRALIRGRKKEPRSLSGVPFRPLYYYRSLRGKIASLYFMLVRLQIVHKWDTSLKFIHFVRGPEPGSIIRREENKTEEELIGLEIKQHKVKEENSCQF